MKSPYSTKIYNTEEKVNFIFIQNYHASKIHIQIMCNDYDGKEDSDLGVWHIKYKVK